MKKPISGSLCFLLCLFSLVALSCAQKMNGQKQDAASKMTKNKVQLISLPAEQRVNVLINGQLFTAYQYPDDIAKPVLYPLLTPSGKMLTRGFPLDAKAGERVDHPHHVGIWLNYGYVNGLDFWNNSEAIPAEKKDKYGTIYHQAINDIQQEDGRASLKVSASWKASDGQTLLDEATTFIFSVQGDTRIIERITKLTAKDIDVSFKDNKEGMFGIRVTRALEFPTEKPVLLTGADGKPAAAPTIDNEGVNGNYLSSEGTTGRGVWGTRGKWMNLYGSLEGEEVAIAILDHPSNPGYPTYWHARDYGLFAANPLGQSALSKGKDELNFALKAGESVTFRYQILVHAGSALSKEEIEAASAAFGSGS